MLRRFRNRACRKAALNVAIGERMRELLIQQGVPAGQVTVVPNWSHEDAIQPLPTTDSRLRSRLGLQERFVVGYSGHLGRAHEWKPVFEAATLLSERAPSIVFLVGGGGHGYEALRDEVARTGLANILFQPYHPMEYLSDSMAASNLHLVSLRPELEGLIVPSKFYGIAAAARPVAFVGDPDGELARLVRQHDCGVAIPAGRGDLLADQILAIAKDEARARRQGENARRLLDSSFSRSAAHDRWHHLLASVASERPDNLSQQSTSPNPR
jgi:glycosyltransferase involved in cell wall biosynthesis